MQQTTQQQAIRTTELYTIHRCANDPGKMHKRKAISQHRDLTHCNITSQNILLQQTRQFDSTAIYIKV
jgi:hypothetical protein